MFNLQHLKFGELFFETTGALGATTLILSSHQVSVVAFTSPTLYIIPDSF